MQSTNRVKNQNNLKLQQSNLTSQLDITKLSDSIESLNIFIEDSVDASAILAKELISISEIESVFEICEVTQHR
ncbi:8519_t:CDS:2, partial [Gigaspora rosea]